MQALSRALFDVMAADTALTSLLGTYGAGPSILTQRPVPTQAKRPLVLAATVAADVEQDFVNAHGREVTRDVGVYGAAPNHFDAVVAAAERVRALFHRRSLTLPGYYSLPIVASGPIDAPADPQEIGRIVTLTIRLRAS